MLFAFRGVRFFQVLLAFIALATGIGAVLSLKVFTDDKVLPMLFVAGFLAIVFLWSFTTAIRVPTSFIAIAPERTRIRFPGFVDTVILNTDIIDATLVRQSLFAGIGVRTDFRGHVVLATTLGKTAELRLRKPIRIWLIPKLIPLRAERLGLTVRNPEKLVARFASTGTTPARPASTAPRAASKMKRRGR